MASNNHKEDEHKEKLKKDILSSIFRKSERPRTLRELGTTTLRNLPSNIGMVQHFMKAVNWQQAQGEVLEGLSNTIVIVGQPNTGKSTLFNKLKGKALSPVSAQAGTTQTVVQTDFGPFTLADTPGVANSGHFPDVVEKAL
ncbi:MAG TPA: GTPase domain-containing protein, partial [Ktedonobacteraceae bacterium]|nr:GTPase domain-containing protein [Ktedonobacteraceae bacterium]